MASLGDFGTRLIGALGGKPSRGGQKLFSSWQRWEGGHTANAATWNPLNLTAPGSGLPTINSVGVVALPNERAGVQRTAKLIRSKYPALAAAFRTGNVDFNDPNVQADLNYWLTGNRTPGMTPYVRKIASSYGAAVPAETAPGRGGGASSSALPRPSQPAQPQRPVFDPMTYARQVLGSYAAGGKLDFTTLPGIVGSSFQAPPLSPRTGGSQPPPAPGAAPSPGKGIEYKGKKLVLPTEWKSTHPTDGLADQGFTHAEDIMGNPGTPVGAPISGTVVRHGSAQGGQSLWLRGDDGRMYWIGHIESNIPVGTKVKRGQTIAAISADHPRPHVHIDWSTSYAG